jgi:hypothetical protein
LLPSLAGSFAILDMIVVEMIMCVPFGSDFEQADLKTMSGSLSVKEEV